MSSVSRWIFYSFEDCESTGNESNIIEDVTMESIDTAPANDHSPAQERLFLVFESALLSLFRDCPTCGMRVTLSTSLQGTLLVVKATCQDDHTFTWHSQPLVGKAAAGNLLLSAAIVFSGSTYTTFANIANLINLSLFSDRTFYKIQQTRIFPIVNAYYNQNQTVVAEILRQQGPLVLSGDGRCDSPGYSAKYCTYSLMDNATGLIIDNSVVQVTETGTSVGMEKEGLQRCLTTVQERLNLKIATLATDRHIQIAAFLKAAYPSINHQFDVWHLSKSVRKKLVKAGSKRGHDTLLLWIQSISNHLWWSAKTCNSDPDLLVAKWTSIVHHIVNVHEWHSDHFSLCAHGPIDDTNGRRKWLKPNSPAHQALQQIVTKPSLVRDVAKLNSFCHTGMLEVFHSLLTKYCPKRQHFSYVGMCVRTQLAILDHNHNIERQQVTTLEGQPRYKLEFPKRSKRWIAKPIKEKKSNSYIDFMLEELVNPTRNVDEFTIELPNLPDNIAPIPRPPLEQAVSEHITRFSSH